MSYDWKPEIGPKSLPPSQSSPAGNKQAQEEKNQAGKQSVYCRAGQLLPQQRDHHHGAQRVPGLQERHQSVIYWILHTANKQPRGSTSTSSWGWVDLVMLTNGN